MVTLKDGILGGASGKVGAVVCDTWKGIPYVRSMDKKTKAPRTKDQVRRRSRFTAAMEFLRKITPFLRVGFQPGERPRMTAMAVLFVFMATWFVCKSTMFWVNGEQCW